MSTSARLYRKYAEWTAFASILSLSAWCVSWFPESSACRFALGILLLAWLVAFVYCINGLMRLLSPAARDEIEPTVKLLIYASIANLFAWVMLPAPGTPGTTSAVFGLLYLVTMAATAVANCVVGYRLYGLPKQELNGLSRPLGTLTFLTGLAVISIVGVRYSIIPELISYIYLAAIFTRQAHRQERPAHPKPVVDLPGTALAASSAQSNA